MKKQREQPKLLVVALAGDTLSPHAGDAGLGEGPLGEGKGDTLPWVHAPGEAHASTTKLCRKEIPKIHLAAFCLSRKCEEH